MGGYVCFEITRQAPDRVARLALLDTTARPDTPALTQRRRAQIALARSGRFAEVAEQQFPLLIHPSRQGDPAVRELVRLMAAETGAEGFIRQQQAIIGRADARPGLGAIGCPTLVLVGDGDQLTPPELSVEIADAIPGGAPGRGGRLRAPDPLGPTRGGHQGTRGVAPSLQIFAVVGDL
jgi:pimeloyl-ACP methyl ester carboxylesterase